MAYERLLDCWQGLLERDPHAPALLGPDGSVWTREQLEAAAQEATATFREASLPPRSILALCLPNGPRWLSVFLACLKRGLVPIIADAGSRREDLSRLAAQVGAAGLWLDGVGLLRREERPRRFRSAAVALGKLTSGSSGTPKCLFFKDREVLDDGWRTLNAFDYQAEDILLGLVPWGHSYGLGSLIAPFLLLGCRIAWPSGPLPGDIERCSALLKPTVFPSVPTVLKALVDSDCRPSSFQSWRCIITAGSRLPPEVASAFVDKYGIPPCNLYGTSETGSICWDPTGEVTRDGIGAGQPLPGVAITQSSAGQVVVSSSSVYTYGNRRLLSSGMGQCVVGDFGSLDESGILRLSARAKGYVKVGERRVGLAEVERRIEELPGVSAAFAFALEREGGAVIAAAIESVANRRELAALLRQKLPSRFRPASWIALDKLPETQRGKRDGRRIRELVAMRSSSR